jgi:hypothetical protein
VWMRSRRASAGDDQTGTKSGSSPKAVLAIANRTGESGELPVAGSPVECSEDRHGTLPVGYGRLKGIPIQVAIPKSISFANMPQGKFETFYTNAVDFIITEVIPGLARDDLEAMVLQFL